MEEAIEARLPGRVFTFVWGLELVADRAFLEGYVDLVQGAGGRVSFVELAATLEERVARNNTEHRLVEKPSKRDRAFNDANLLELEEYVLNTSPGVRLPAHDLLDHHLHVRIENTELTPEQAAARALDALGLPVGA